jgi:hypothetical protein
MSDPNQKPNTIAGEHVTVTDAIIDSLQDRGGDNVVTALLEIARAIGELTQAIQEQER